MAAEQNKPLIQRLAEEAANQSNLDVPAVVADGELAQAARRRLGIARVTIRSQSASESSVTVGARVKTVSFEA